MVNNVKNLRYPPYYLLQLIAKFYSNEYVYLMDCTSVAIGIFQYKLWETNVDFIFQFENKN